jgi:hypothetical protein
MVLPSVSTASLLVNSRGPLLTYELPNNRTAAAACLYRLLLRLHSPLHSLIDWQWDWLLQTLLGSLLESLLGSRLVSPLGSRLVSLLGPLFGSPLDPRLGSPLDSLLGPLLNSTIASAHCSVSLSSKLYLPSDLHIRSSNRTKIRERQQ